MTKYTLKSNDIISTSDKKYNLIKDLPNEKKPREKLIKGGPSNLSSAELLSIILGTGTKKEEVSVMVRRIIKEYGEKTLMNQTDVNRLVKELAIPENKACQIVACFELGRRFFSDKKIGTTVIRTPKQAFEYLKDMRTLTKEQFRGLYLNSRYQVIHSEVISIGTLTASLVHPREVFRPAIEYSAAAIIIAHNHPSGRLKATEADEEITKKLLKAAEIIGIDILDHIIITKNNFNSIISHED